MPVYKCIMAVRPDVVVYIYSKDSEPEYRRICSMVEFEEDRQEPLDAVDPFAIRTRTESLLEKYQEDHITLNITGGLKSWAYFFTTSFVGRKNVDVLYLDQNNILWNYTKMSGADAGVHIDMQTSFRLTGNPLVKYSDLSTYTEDDDRVAQELEKLRCFNYTEFTSLLSTLSKEDSHNLKNNQKGAVETRAFSSVKWEKSRTDGREDVQIHLRKGMNSSELSLNSEHAVSLAFNTGWFEFKVARLLSKWHEAINVYLNCTFPYAPNLDRNEVDIIVETKSRLLFVECKTQVYNSTDIDKFSTVVRRYGGNASMALFVTESPMASMPQDKCRSSDILLFSLKDEKKQLRKHKDLFDMLDSSLNKIRK